MNETLAILTFTNTYVEFEKYEDDLEAEEVMNLHIGDDVYEGYYRITLNGRIRGYANPVNGDAILA